MEEQNFTYTDVYTRKPCFVLTSFYVKEDMTFLPIILNTKDLGVNWNEWHASFNAKNTGNFLT